MTRLFFLFLAASVLCASAAMADKSAKKLYIFGDSAQTLGRAGTGVSSSGVDLFYLNPASIGDLDRIGTSLQYGTLPPFTGLYSGNMSVAAPTSYGVFGASLRYMCLPSSHDFRNGYSVTIGGGKDVIPQLILGFSLTFFSGLDSGRPYYTGGTFGLIYKFNSTAERYGFCLYEPKIGLSVQFGYPFGTRKHNADFNAITLGYSFKFFKIKDFNIAFFNDASVLNYREYPVKIGLEPELYDMLSLRVGYVIPHAYNDGNFTAGLGFKFNSENFKGSLNYSINFYPRLKLVHYLGLTGEYGTLDREPPETVIEADNRYISPNHDGVQDYVLFRTSVIDRSLIKGWRLQILDSSDRIVKVYSFFDRDVINPLGFRMFFKRLFSKKESMVVPEKIIWDGTNFKGETVPDGKYTYSFTVWDARDNISDMKSGTIIVDTVPPEAVLEKSEPFFSPNAGNKKGEFTITQKIKTTPDDVWIAGFRDAHGMIVKSYRWDGSTVPGKVVWNGTDDAGAEAPEGVYEYFIQSVDKAGNRAFAEIRAISLTRQYAVADVTLSSEYFSFNKDASLTLFPFLSNAQGLVRWKITILNAAKKIVREISGYYDYPKMIQYDCRDAKNEKLAEGAYYAKFAAEFNGGNAPESFEKKFIVHSAPPELSVSHSPRLFSPDGDGDNDILTIRLSSLDAPGIARWSLCIYSSSGEVFRAFSGKGPLPGEIIWNGLGNNLEIVESAADYFIVLEAADLAGNVGKSNPDRLSVDILVLAAERGYTIRVSNIEFSFGSDEIKRSGRGALDRVYDVLRKYEAYDVVIEGHTDDAGSEEHNLELSERRARAVHDYLVKSGIRADGLRYVGMGETVPLYPNDSDEHRRRNRRVEFLLVKRDAK